MAAADKLVRGKAVVISQTSPVRACIASISRRDFAEERSSKLWPTGLVLCWRVRTAMIEKAVSLCLGLLSRVRFDSKDLGSRQNMLAWKHSADAYSL